MMHPVTIITGNANQLPLEDHSVDLIVTSPPYFGLRAYQDGGVAYDGQVGSEATPQEFLAALWLCACEWWRVLKPEGSLWVNLGDKYAGSNGQSGGPSQLASATYSPDGRRSKDAKKGHHVPKSDIRRKSLMGLPWRYAIGMIDGEGDPTGAGWILRAEVIWAKPNGLPESVTDRVRRSHEQWFHFVKQERYFSAIDEIREVYLHNESKTARRGPSGPNRGVAVGRTHEDGKSVGNFCHSGSGRLPCSVWDIPTQPLVVPEELGIDHFAAFPIEFPRRIILGWSPSGICTECNQPREAVVSKEKVGGRIRTKADTPALGAGRVATGHMAPGALHGFTTTATITGYRCSCETTAAQTRPAVVLDPFGGTGTTAAVARALGRKGITNDLSHDYNRLAEWRCHGEGFNKIMAKIHGTKPAKKTAGDGQLDLLAGDPT